MNRACAAGIIAGVLASGAAFGAGPADSDRVTTVGAHEVVELALPAEAGDPFDVTVPLGGQQVTLELTPHSLRAPDFHAYVVGDQGRVEIEPPAPATYRGVTAPVGGRVAASLIDGRLHAFISLDDGTTWAVEPLRGADPSRHMVYSDDDLVGGFECGVPDAPNMIEGLNLGNDVSPAGGDLLECEVGIDSDWEFYSNFGNGEVDATIVLMELTLNGTSMIYENDVAVKFKLTGLIVRTNENDPYQGPDSGDLLDQMTNEWAQNQQDIPHDVAQLISGQDFSGSVIGLAWVGVVCEQNRYSIIQAPGLGDMDKIGVSAHEIGHNFAANHCDVISPCNIMCSGLGGCSMNISKFAPISANIIHAFANTRPCLEPYVECPADFNGDGNLNILDFVDFQLAWTAQDEAGDCDANGSYNILDFVCFQVLFAGGCP